MVGSAGRISPILAVVLECDLSAVALEDSQGAGFRVMVDHARRRLVVNDTEVPSTPIRILIQVDRLLCQCMVCG